MTRRDRLHKIGVRRRPHDGGLLILVLALALALFVGSSFKTVGGRTTPVVMWYLDASTGELVNTAMQVKLPSRRVEQASVVVDLLRTPPVNQGLVTSVPAGFVARRATLLPGGILHVAFGVARGQSPIGYAEEEALYWQLVNSLFSLPQVRSVEVSVDGSPTGTFLSFVKTQREQTTYAAMLDKGQPEDLYFIGQDGRYVVERRTLPTDLTRSQIAFQATRALMDGPEHPSLTSSLPGTEYLRGVTISGRTATVDFEEKALVLSMGAQEEERAVTALVLTLTRLPGVSRVRLQVGGHAVQGLFGHVDTALPLFRLDGRLEAGTALSVYSLTKVDGSELPVLTIVPQAPALTGRNEMISKDVALLGAPSGGDTSLIPHGTSVEGMVFEANTGTLRLSLRLPSMPESLEAEARLVEQLRLTFTELPSVTSLQLTINGSVSFLSGGYYIGKPFAR
ncbi:MAG: GerMN domain-containing protein [Candidatus Cryosericum sp.]